MQAPVSGLILAGGRSRRFGSDKAAHEIGGQAMIEMAYEALRAVTDDVIVSVRHEQQRYDVQAAYVVDRYRRMGPLAGLDAGFARARHDWLFVVACDMPLISGADVEMIIDGRRPGVDAVVARDVDGLMQPLCACYHRPVVGRQAKLLLQQRHLSMMGLLERLKVQTVRLSETALINVNRRADLQMISLS